MQFGIFYEHQLPQPWRDGDERRLFMDALEQVELADRLGFDYAWEVEHHFLEEYSHSSAPEVFLAACSQRTRTIRLGHGITLMPPGYNHPARVAERIATLDLVSNGRVDWGAGESSSRIELEGFAISPMEKRAMWLEAVRECAKMQVMRPYLGYSGAYFSMPARNVVPKPVQQPHPPLWMACSSREAIRLAAQLGMGALTFAFIDPAEAKQWVDEYYAVFAAECTPIGRAVNPTIAMVTGFMCHEDSATAAARGLEGFQFFGYGLGHYYLNGSHIPGRFDLWQDFQRHRTQMSNPNMTCIGSPAEIRARLEQFEAAGVDQVIFVQQAGNNRHEHICASLELFAERVLPAFQERHTARARRKAEALGPAIDRAQQLIPPLPKLEIAEPVDAYPVMMRKAGVPLERPSTPGIAESLGLTTTEPQDQ
jgi:alkanesulfonate monooxygenase SsuD/methylene tetrahydromethanopterin reductase-like flavin-dependent oxidoreductase (luciferase family)